MTAMDARDYKKAAVLTEQEKEVVTGGREDIWSLDQAKHYCSKCKKKTMQYVASNGYVCSACGTLNK